MKLDAHSLLKPLASMIAAALLCAGATDARAQTEAPEVPDERGRQRHPLLDPRLRPRSPRLRRRHRSPRLRRRHSPRLRRRPPQPAPSAPPQPAPSAPPPQPAPLAAPPSSDDDQRAPPATAEAPQEVPVVAVRPVAPGPDLWSIWPGARLDVDGGAVHDTADLLVRRARLQATGWIGSSVYFSSALEYAAPPGAAAAVFAPTDVFVAVAPSGPLAVLQAGQFDAPFSLENRTVDYTLNFLERSTAVRDFGIPENKATGAMLTGVDDARHFHYSLGVFNGDGPSLRSLDGQFDFMARAWLAPFSFTGEGPLRDLTLGGSFWVGDRANALPLDAQTTSGGFAFARFDPYATTAGGPPLQLRQVGRRIEAAAELDAPLGPRYGARAEVLWRRSPLSEEDLSDPLHPTILGGADLDGWAAYGRPGFGRSATSAPRLARATGSSRSTDAGGRGRSGGPTASCWRCASRTSTRRSGRRPTRPSSTSAIPQWA